jgi:hypothetical protein
MAVSKCINCKSLDAIKQWDMAIVKFSYADFIAFIERVENVVLERLIKIPRFRCTGTSSVILFYCMMSWP